MEARMTLGYLSQGCHAILLLKSTSSNLGQPKTFDLLPIGLIKSHSSVVIIMCVRMEGRTCCLRILGNVAKHHSVSIREHRSGEEFGTRNVWSEVPARALDASAYSTYYVCQQVAGHATKGAPRTTLRDRDQRKPGKL